MRAYGSLLVFDKGDDVLALLQQFVVEQRIPSAWFQAIGAFGWSVIAYEETGLELIR